MEEPKKIGLKQNGGFKRSRVAKAMPPEDGPVSISDSLGNKTR
jgi:hypothetical protein